MPDKEQADNAPIPAGEKELVAAAANNPEQAAWLIEVLEKADEVAREISEQQADSSGTAAS
jgi:hypothetical protein